MTPGARGAKPDADHTGAGAGGDATQRGSRATRATQRNHGSPSAKAKPSDPGADAILRDSDGSVTFVDRTHELEQLQRMFERSRAGRPAFVAIDGDMGMGKSLLVEEFGRQAARAGARVLRGNCVALQERGLPYAPFRQALRDPGDDPGLRAAIDAASSELTDLLTGSDELAATEHTRSRRITLFESLLRLFHDLAASRPLLFVVEDLHRADHTTLDLLTFLSHNLRAVPALCLMTHSPVPASDAPDGQVPMRVAADDSGGALDGVADPLPSGGEASSADDAMGTPTGMTAAARSKTLRDFLYGHAGGGITDRVHLKGFGPLEVAEQVFALTGRRPSGDDVEELLGRSGGNPLFVAQLVANGAPGDSTVPHSQVELFLRQAEALPDVVRTLVDLAAVAGRSVEYDLLRAAADMSSDVLDDLLRDAIAAGVLHKQVDGQYTFRHAPMRDVLCGELPFERRREMHRRFADVLVARRRHQLAAPGAIASHWDHANEKAKALRAYLQSAEAAKATFGFADAERFLRRALQLWDQVDEVERPADATWRRLANMAIDAALAVERSPSMIEVAEQALDDARRTRDLHIIAYQRSQLGQLHWFAGDEDAGLEHTAAAVAAVDEEMASREQARIFAFRSSVLAINGRYTEAGALAQRALDAAIRSGAPGAYRDALVIVASVAARQGDREYGLRLLDEAEDLARLRNDAGEVMRIVLHRGRVHQAYAQWELARATYLAGLTDAPKYGMHQRYSWRFRVLAARMSFMQGRWQDAELELEHAADLVEGMDAALPSLLVATGRFEQAEEIYGRPRSRWRSDGTGLLQRPEGPVELAVWLGRLDDARRLYNDGLEPLVGSEELVPQAQLCWAGLRAEADIAEQRPDERDQAIARAAALLDRLRGLHASRPPRPDGFGRELALLAAMGEAEFSRVRGAPDPDAWQVAVEWCDALAMPYPAIYARWRRSQALRHLDRDRRLAAELLDGALADAKRLGARPLYDVMRGFGPRPTSPAEMFTLTPRQQQVADMLLEVERITDRQIADRLGIAKGTVSVHVSNMMAKAAVTSRMQLIELLRRRGGGEE